MRNCIASKYSCKIIVQFSVQFSFHFHYNIVTIFYISSGISHQAVRPYRLLWQLDLLRLISSQVIYLRCLSVPFTVKFGGGLWFLSGCSPIVCHTGLRSLFGLYKVLFQRCPPDGLVSWRYQDLIYTEHAS